MKPYRMSPYGLSPIFRSSNSNGISLLQENLQLQTSYGIKFHA